MPTCELKRNQGKRRESLIKKEEEWRALVTDLISGQFWFSVLIGSLRINSQSLPVNFYAVCSGATPLAEPPLGQVMPCAGSGHETHVLQFEALHLPPSFSPASFIPSFLEYLSSIAICWAYSQTLRMKWTSVFRRRTSWWWWTWWASRCWICLGSHTDGEKAAQKNTE